MGGDFEKPLKLNCSLDKDVAFYKSHTFAPSTSRIYLAQKSAYFEFCDKMIIQPVPLSQQDLGHYIAYLLCRLCFTSVRQYLNIVRLLHIKSGFANPLDNNWYSAASVTFRFVSLVSMTHFCV